MNKKLGAIYISVYTIYCVYICFSKGASMIYKIGRLWLLYIITKKHGLSSCVISHAVHLTLSKSCQQRIDH